MSGNEILIEEVSGPNPIRVVLRDRAMPYRGMPTGGEQRIVTTWYQGNPKATQQILGEELDSTTLEGRWKSKFVTIGGDVTSMVQVTNAPEGLGVRADSNPAGLVVSLFERLRARGKELRFQWGEVIRYGLLGKFTPTWDRIEDVDWSMTFEWNGTVERVSRSGAAITFGQPVQTALVKSDDALVAMPREVVPSASTDILSRMSAVRARTLDLLTYTRQAQAAVTFPLRVVQGAAGVVSEVREVAADVVAQCLSVPYEAFSTFDTVVDVFKVESFRRSLGVQVDSLSARAIEERNRMRAVKGAETDASFVRVRQKTSLRSIALQVYGSADDWEVIARANGMHSSIVETGTLLVIPVRSTAEGEGT